MHYRYNTGMVIPPVPSHNMYHIINNIPYYFEIYPIYHIFIFNIKLNPYTIHPSHLSIPFPSLMLSLQITYPLIFNHEVTYIMLYSPVNLITYLTYHILNLSHTSYLITCLIIYHQPTAQTLTLPKASPET